MVSKLVNHIRTNIDKTDPMPEKVITVPRVRDPNFKYGKHRKVSMVSVSNVDYRHGTDAEIQIGTLCLGLSAKEFLSVMETMQKHLADNPELIILAKK